MSEDQELLGSIHYALQNILIFRCKESDAPFSADMHLCQAIERLYSQIEFEPTDEETVEHLDYALSIVEAAKPSKGLYLGESYNIKAERVEENTITV